MIVKGLEVMKILYTTKEAFLKAKAFFDACRYEWTFEDQGNDNYLVTIFY